MAVIGGEGDVRLSHGELAARANRLARQLMERGLGPGQLAGLSLSRTPDMLVGLLGILKTGAGYVPLDPDFPGERLAYMMEDAGLSLLLTESALQDRLPAGGQPVVCLDQLDLASGPATPPAVPEDPNQTAYVIYTSGSTGRPKGVQVPHRCVVNFLHSMLEAPGLGADDTLLAVTTLSFDIAVLELYGPLLAGGRVWVADKATVGDGARLMARVSAPSVRVMQATPATWQLLRAAGWTGRADLKVLCGGEALPADLADWLASHCGEVWNLYGPTETTVWSTAWQVEAGAPVRIGRPIGNTRVHVLDGHGQPVPVGVWGELYIGGEGVSAGYLNRAELTAERFVADPFSDTPGARLYRTGDRVRWDRHGQLEYDGRLDHQVKVRGYRIELGEIESVLKSQAAVREAVVVVREDLPGDVRLVAYYVATDEVTVTVLRAHLRERLPEYMIPQHFVALESLPLTPNGKVDRKALPAPFAGSFSQARVAPRTEAERIIAGIWSELIGTDQISVTDNFFDLGGHSLLAIQAITRINRETGATLSPMVMVMHTLEEIAHECEGSLSRNDTAATAAEPVSRPEETGLGGRLKRLFRGMGKQ